MSTVAIGCKLPNGLAFPTADGSVDESGNRKRITLNGSNTSVIIGQNYGITHIDAAEADVFFATHAELAAVKNKMIFRHGNSDKVEDIRDMAKDFSELKTGQEGLNPNAPVPGIKAADDQVTDPEEAAAKFKQAQTGRKPKK